LFLGKNKFFLSEDHKSPLNLTIKITKTKYYISIKPMMELSKLSFPVKENFEEYNTISSYQALKYEMRLKLIQTLI
jgi:hypothetical protein